MYAAPEQGRVCEHLTRSGEPIARVMSPTGIGNPDIEVIRDGRRPSPGSTDPLRQYDTYDGVNGVDFDWIGYAFDFSPTWEMILFQEGRHYGNGGWFESLIVEVRQGDDWVDVTGLSITPEYPFRNDGRSFDRYTLRFDPIDGSGIRLVGRPGGSAAFISVAELWVYADCRMPRLPALPECRDLSGRGDIIARVTDPTGAGSRDLGVIRDGDMPLVGNRDASRHYDTFDGSNRSGEDWIGYVYSSAYSWEAVLFQEGKHFPNGGWFTKLTVEVRQGGVWVDVGDFAITPRYHSENNGFISYEAFVLTFDPIVGDGIRLFGEPGGSADFISVGELLVFGDCDSPPDPPDPPDPDPPSDPEEPLLPPPIVPPPTASCDTDLTTEGGIIALVTAPTGVSSPGIGVIRDGDLPPTGNLDPLRNYDTFDGVNVSSEDWIGYEFGSEHEWEEVLFQEGLHFGDGGWFDTLTVQVRQGGVWVAVTGLTVTKRSCWRSSRSAGMGSGSSARPGGRPTSSPSCGSSETAGSCPRRRLTPGMGSGSSARPGGRPTSSPGGAAGLRRLRPTRSATTGSPTRRST